MKSYFIQKNVKSNFYNCLLLLCFIVVTSNANAQFRINSNPYWQGEIKLTDGSVKKGYIKVPNSSKVREISFKQSENEKKESISRKLIESVIVVSKNGNNFLFENTPNAMTLKAKKPTGTALLLVASKNNYVTFYVEAGGYEVDNKNGTINLFNKYTYGKSFPTSFYYIKKRDASFAKTFYMTDQLGGIKKSAKIHLNEDKALQERINKRKLKKKDVVEIISIYTKTTEKL